MTLQLNSIKKALLGTLAAAPLVVAGTLANAGSAHAAALTGEFQFSGGGTTATVSQTKLDFTEPGQIFVNLQTGTFTPFTTAYINDLESIPTNAPLHNPFLDLGADDGIDVFNLTKIGNYNFAQSGNNVAIDIAVFGKFLSASGDLSNGAGNLTFQVNNKTVNEVKTLLANGGSLNVTFSGGAFASVPEPTTILGLGVVGGAMVASRRRKASQAS